MCNFKQLKLSTLFYSTLFEDVHRLNLSSIFFREILLSSCRPISVSITDCDAIIPYMASLMNRPAVLSIFLKVSSKISLFCSYALMLSN